MAQNNLDYDDVVEKFSSEDELFDYLDGKLPNNNQNIITAQYIREALKSLFESATHNIKNDVDDNCLVIDFCKRLDLSEIDNEVVIQIPEGYIADPCASGTYLGTILIETYGSNTDSWITNAGVTVKYVRADNSQEVSDDYTFTNYNSSTINLVPFVKNYIKAIVNTAAEGAYPYAVVRGRIYCHKEN